MLINNEKIVIYPFSYKSFPEVKILLENKYEIKVLSQLGTGLIGKDIAFSTNRKNSNILVEKLDRKIITNCDVLYIPEGNIEDPLYLGIEEVLDFAIEAGIKIISAIDLKSTNLDLEKYDKFIDLHNSINKSLDSYFLSIKKNRLSYYSPKIPVIIIGGIFDIIDNQYITLALKKQFEENGYEVCCITKEITGKLFDCLTFPENFMNNNHSIEARILELNSYIRASTELFKPQVLIIQVPFGMIRYNNYLENSFGSYAFMISQAITADYFICTATPERLDAKYYNEISDYFHRKYDNPISCLHISNYQPEITNSRSGTNQEFIFIDEKKLEEDIFLIDNKLEFMVTNLFEENCLKNLLKDILKQLG